MTEAKRKPRFRRIPEPEAIQITERDLTIIRQVYKHRFLNTVQIVALIGGSGDRIKRRLQALYHHGYLDRPPEQNTFHYFQGARPMVYGLGDKGADLLQARYGIERGKIRWTAKNRIAGQIFIDHTLMVSEFMVRLELAVRRREDLRLISQSTLLKVAPAATLEKTNPLLLRINGIRDQGETVSVSVVPDEFFALQFQDQPKTNNTFFYFLEADRATMPVKTRQLAERRSSIFKKMVAYFHAWRQDLHKAQLGISGFRVLFLTTSAQRVENMIAVNKVFMDGEGTRMFLFGEQEGLFGCENLLDYGWRNGRDDTVVRLGG